MSKSFVRNVAFVATLAFASVAPSFADSTPSAPTPIHPNTVSSSPSAPTPIHPNVTSSSPSAPTPIHPTVMQVVLSILNLA